MTIVKPPGPPMPSSRWCDACGHGHGPLYLCPKYPDEVKAEVLAADAIYRKALADAVPATPEEKFHLDIFKMFAGPDPAEKA